MSLRTKMDSGHCIVGKIHDVSMDAVYAHALVIAIGEEARNWNPQQQRGEVSETIMERADELMREWGYSEDTNESSK